MGQTERQKLRWSAQRDRLARTVRLPKSRGFSSPAGPRRRERGTRLYVKGGWGVGGDSTLGSRVAMKLVIFANCDPKMIFYFVEKKRFFLASNHNFAKLFSSSMAEVGRRNSVVVLAHSPHYGWLTSIYIGGGEGITTWEVESNLFESCKLFESWD